MHRGSRRAKCRVFHGSKSIHKATVALTNIPFFTNSAVRGVDPRSAPA